MAWPGPRRPLVGVRLDADTIDALDQRAEAEGLILPRGEANRSEMLRRLVAYGLEHMPAGYKSTDR